MRAEKLGGALSANSTPGYRSTNRDEAVLTALGDKIRELSDPDDLAYAAGEISSTALQVSRVEYGEIDIGRETITTQRDWNAPGIKSLAGTLLFRDYGSHIEDLKRGETVVFNDAAQDPRSEAGAEALKAISAQPVVNMPVTEQGGPSLCSISTPLLPERGPTMRLH